MYLESVKEFHETFNHPVLSNPTIPNKSRCELRINLMQEELNEIKQGIENNDINEIADGLCDLMYVLAGSIHEFGLGNKFEELFKEVQRSNMSKACNTEQEAIDTVNYYLQRDNTVAEYKHKGDKWIVYRKSDNKLLKSINYSSANLDNILKNGS
jgi:predicted HAD superfamily Cof-like phosphohydrolase